MSREKDADVEYTRTDAFIEKSCDFTIYCLIINRNNSKKNYMKFYHGTTPENWLKILEEGILFGRRYVVNKDGDIIKELSRCTYLSPIPEEANNYGDILLEVEYNPLKSNKNNYEDGCYQIRVYEPIPINKVKVIRLIDIKPMYIRFGELPQESFSKIYQHGEEIGHEVGVSCYRAFMDDFGNLSICFPLPVTKQSLSTFQGLIEYDNRPAFLITGDLVGYGSDGEPLLTNVLIAKNLGFSYRQK